jgi:hypothetical protein
MPRISITLSDDDLAIIDAVAAPNRTAFVVAAARETAVRVRRSREDAEIETIMRENAGSDAVLTLAFDCTLRDCLC